MGNRACFYFSFLTTMIAFHVHIKAAAPIINCQCDANKRLLIKASSHLCLGCRQSMYFLITANEICFIGCCRPNKDYMLTCAPCLCSCLRFHCSRKSSLSEPLFTFVCYTQYPFFQLYPCEIPVLNIHSKSAFLFFVDSQSLSLRLPPSLPVSALYLGESSPARSESHYRLEAEL